MLLHFAPALPHSAPPPPAVPRGGRQRRSRRTQRPRTQTCCARPTHSWPSCSARTWRATKRRRTLQVRRGGARAGAGLGGHALALCWRDTSAKGAFEECCVSWWTRECPCPAHCSSPGPVTCRLCPSIADDFADDVSTVEEALRQRMSATLEAATAVLQLVEAQAAAGGGSAGGDADADAGLPSPTTGGARGRASNSKDAQVRMGFVGHLRRC